ncbi:MAG: mycofactocin biosynthesis glycosyltransferase MftF [Candidatus Dormibacteraeota bacterium]|nr:mycofactocin biosynthesis glycosyltransferase MftF [Candidatus Dormibacteraeota bacterium]
MRERGRRFAVQGQPLTVLELTEEGWRLLRRSAPGIELEAAPHELRFLRRLRELGLVEMRPVAGEPPPVVSVIVPVRDRGHELGACLRSLRALDYPADRLEILVVDDASAEPVAAASGVRVLRRERPGGPAAARNQGAAAARGEVLAFLDSDCRAAEDWLRRLIPELADLDVDLAGGRVLGDRRGGWAERYEAACSSLDLGPRYGPVGAGRMVPYLVTANLVVRRAAFQALGGFDAGLRFGEDVDLVWRAVAAGRRAVYQPAATVRHLYRPTTVAFAQTRLDYAASEALLLRRHPGATRRLRLGLGLLAAVAALLSGRPGVAAAGLAGPFLETWGTAARLEAAGLGRRLSLSLAAGVEGTALELAARALVRYYGAATLLVALVWPRSRKVVAAALALAVAAPAMADWWRLRPRLSLPAFIGARLLDDAAYQAGVLRGCLRERTAAPLRARVSTGWRGWG